MKRCQLNLYKILLINDVVQFINSFNTVVLNINYLLLKDISHSLYKKQVQIIGALNVELFDAIQHAPYLLCSLRNAPVGKSN